MEELPLDASTVIRSSVVGDYFVKVIQLLAPPLKCTLITYLTALLYK